MRILLLLCFGVSVAWAEGNCPWMNAATAAGFLGSEVTARFVANSKLNDSGQCDFLALSKNAATLRIEVSIMQSAKTQFAGFLAKCGSDAKPVKSIGNEAVVCTSAQQERIVGRVRDQTFVVTLTPGDAGKEELIKKAAEIVAGNLF